MKKTLDGDQAASSVLKYLLHFLIVALFYGFILYTTLYLWVPVLIARFSVVTYSDVSTHFNNELALLLILYSLFCYAANNFLLDLYHRKKSKQLIFSIIGDILVLPIAIIITIFIDNHTVVSRITTTDSIYNIYVIVVVLVLKEVAAAAILSKKGGDGKKVR